MITENDAQNRADNFQDSIGFLLHSLKQKMKQKMNERLKPFGITTEQRALLLILSDHGAITQSMLSELASMEPSNLTVTLNRLVKKGYIEKIDHPSDSRAYLLNLTETSSVLIQDLKTLSTQIGYVILEGIDENDIKITKHTLQKMLENLR